MLWGKKQGLILLQLWRSHKTVSVCSEIQQLYSRENGSKMKSLQQTELILYLTLNIKHVLSKTIKLFSVIMAILAIYSISIYCTEAY